LDRQSRGFLLFAAIVCDIFLGLLDYLVGHEINFSVFYLIPVFLVTSSKSRFDGLVVSLVCTGTLLADDLVAGRVFSRFWIPYWNALELFCFFVIVSVLLSSIRRYLASLEELSRTDPLTGAANSRGFRELVQLELDRSLRYKNAITIAYFDVDDFKAINDRFGHCVGDEVLARIGEVISQNIRNTDKLGRLGGDEFAILLPQTEHGSAQGFVTRLKQILTNGIRVNGCTLTFSFGVVTFETPPASVDEMIRKADDLMYSAKRGGKDSVRFETWSG